MLVLTGLLGSSIHFVGQSSNQSILPDGVYVQSFEFRPLFRTGAEEAEWNPTNPFDPKPREGTIGSTPMPGRDPSTEALMRKHRSVMALRSTRNSAEILDILFLTIRELESLFNAGVIDSHPVLGLKRDEGRIERQVRRRIPPSA